MIDADRSRRPVTILKLGAEGGGISLFGYQGADATWTFYTTLVDHTPTLLMGEDAGETIKRRTEPIAGWETALALLDTKYGYWPRLTPTVVHPDFRTAILSAVRARKGAEEAERWSERIETIDRMAQRRARRLDLA